MMVYKALKNVAILLFVAMIAVGCSSSSKKGGDSSADSAGAGVNSGMDDNTVVINDVDAGQLGAVFYFEFDSSELSSAVRSQLSQQADMLKNRAGVVRLEGNTDERGTREYNMALGERRAKAVSNYLASLGIPNSQMETISYGEEKPAALGHDESAWAQNRRVQLIYVD